MSAIDEMDERLADALVMDNPEEIEELANPTPVNLSAHDHFGEHALYKARCYLGR